MATSAAALALYMGVYDVRTDTVRKLQMVLGVTSGKSLVSDPSGDVAGSTVSYCRVRHSSKLILTAKKRRGKDKQNKIYIYIYISVCSRGFTVQLSKTF